MKQETKVEIFEEAFGSDTAGSCRECDCGKVFYNSNGGWDWEDGELAGLNGSDAVDLDYSVGTVIFESKEYCKDCTCWHKRALAIFDFLVTHNYKIASFFKHYKAQKQKEAEDIKEI